MTLIDIPLIHDDQCRRFQSAVELVGKRWSSGILMALSLGSTRFSEVLVRVDGLSDRLLAQRLKELERDGLIEREVVATTPVQVRYRLSTKGEELMDLLRPLTAWEHKWSAIR